jgi:hypothetical protein
MQKRACHWRGDFFRQHSQPCSSAMAMPVISVVNDIMGGIQSPPTNQDSKEPQTQQIISISSRLNNVYAIRGLPFLIFVRRRAYIAKPGF